MAAVWMVGLAAVVGLGVVGGRMIDVEPAPIAPLVPVVPDAVAPERVAAVPPVAPFIGIVPPASSRLFLNQPSRRNLTINTRDLFVAGRLVGAGAVRITLENRKAHVLEAVTIEAPAGLFSTRLALPNPRPGGQLIVQVVAYDADGIPREAIRRPFDVGRVAQPLSKMR